VNIEDARAKRLQLWRQDGRNNLPDSAGAVQLINQMGLVTLYGASPEFPSLLLAHIGRPDYIAEASWDTPAGFVYGWRWDLGKAASAFYSTIVAKKPTWVSWLQLPTVLGALLNRQEPAEFYRSGQLSRDAWKLFEALEGSKEPLTTKELRLAAGFPTGKENRAAYLKAVEELETHLWLAKVFSPSGEGDEMSHGLVSKLYPDAFRKAISTERGDAIRALAKNHLSSSVFIDAAVFTKHLRLDQSLVNGVLESMTVDHLIAPLEGAKNCYISAENV